MRKTVIIGLALACSALGAPHAYADNIQFSKIPIGDLPFESATGGYGVFENVSFSSLGALSASLSLNGDTNVNIPDFDGNNCLNLTGYADNARFVVPFYFDAGTLYTNFGAGNWTAFALQLWDSTDCSLSGSVVDSTTAAGLSWVDLPPATGTPTTTPSTSETEFAFAALIGMLIFVIGMAGALFLLRKFST